MTTHSMDARADSGRALPRRAVHPSVFTVLIAPFGVIGGYLTVAVAYSLSRAGLSVEQVAALVALSYVPHTWKFAWAPIADTTLSRRAWYVIASVVTGLGIFFTGVLPARPSSIPLLSAVVLLSNFAVTFLGMSVESMMAYDTPEEEKGRAGGWFQAGNLGGNGIGGGMGLWLTQHVGPHWMAPLILGAACVACTAALWFVHEPAAPHRTGGIARNLVNVGRDLWSVLRARIGFLALVLCFLPIGSGAASGLWSAVAPDWRASAGTVALVTGVFGGIVSAIGCVLGGWICDRTPRKTAYAAFGVLQAMCAVGMALAPRTQSMYVVFTMLYALVTGLTYAGFSAFVLEAMGKGAAATKYNVYAALSNTPIYYMTLTDGWAHANWGPGGMLLTEAAVGMIGLVVFIAVALALPGPGGAGRPVPNPGSPAEANLS